MIQEYFWDKIKTSPKLLVKKLGLGKKCVKENFQVQKLLVQRLFCLQKFWQKKHFGIKKNGKNSIYPNFVFLKEFEFKRILGPKKLMAINQ